MDFWRRKHDDHANHDGSHAAAGRRCPGRRDQCPCDYTRIQEAIDAASSGDTISIAAGTYNELIDFTGKPITVHGAGPLQTTIDGTGIEGSVVTFTSGEGPGSILRDVTLTGGTGTIAPDPVFGNVLCGGGLYLFGSSPTIKNCLVTENITWGGGGMFNLFSSPNVEECTFRSNQAEGHGGGSYNLDHSDPKFTDCVFELNDATWGGGMTSTVDCSPTLTDCDFIANSIFSVGGGMFNRSRSSPTITGCCSTARFSRAIPWATAQVSAHTGWAPAGGRAIRSSRTATLSTTSPMATLAASPMPTKCSPP